MSSIPTNNDQLTDVTTSDNTTTETTQSTQAMIPKLTKSEAKQRVNELRQELNDTHAEMAALQDQLQVLTQTFQNDAMKLIAMVQQLGQPAPATDVTNSDNKDEQNKQ